MPYNLDLSAISIPEYQTLLMNQNLLPGRRILLQNIEQNFVAIQKQGINNLAQLKKALSTPQKLIALAESCRISEEYLTILRRELGSLEQKPLLLASFPGVDAALITTLTRRGIKTTKDYFEGGFTESEELASLCDLVRINGVGAAAAKTFYEAGFHSVADVAGADAAEMLARVTAINESKSYYKAKLGVKDMQFCIDFARLLMKYGG